jgi:hypothetical protein
MHNRESIWYTQEGEKLILKNIKTTHLTNIINMIRVNEKNYNSDTIKTFEQELRYRKLNRIENNPDNIELF